MLKDEFAKDYWADLMRDIADERREGLPVYPPESQVFRALELTWCENTKVVIVGQDPYRGENQADGLCFSVPCDVRPPPSLVNIHKELHDDRRLPIPNHGSLKAWAHRGVLLLNPRLTTRGGERDSHPGRERERSRDAAIRAGWESFTDAVVRVAAAERDPVFLLWGAVAQRKEELIRRITGSPDKIIKSSHPSPLSANRPCGDSPPFLGSRPFSRANQILCDAGREGIDWNLSP